MGNITPPPTLTNPVSVIASQHLTSSLGKPSIDVIVSNLDWGTDTYRRFTLDPARSGSLNTPNKVSEKIHECLCSGKALRLHVLPNPSVILIPYQAASKAVFEIVSTTEI